MSENLTQTSRRDEDPSKDFLERALISMGIIFASTLAGALWVTLSISGATYNQNLQGSLFGFLVGVILVLTALLAAKR